LHLPTRTLVAEVVEREPNAALDKLCDVLAGEIKRHRDQLRHDWDYRRKGHGAEKNGALANGALPDWPSPWPAALGSASTPDT
jgi:hypothetical protein